MHKGTRIYKELVRSIPVRIDQLFNEFLNVINDPDAKDHGAPSKVDTVFSSSSSSAFSRRFFHPFPPALNTR